MMANLITPSEAECELREAQLSLPRMMEDMDQMREDLGRAEDTINSLRAELRMEREATIAETDQLYDRIAELEAPRDIVAEELAAEAEVNRLRRRMVEMQEYIIGQSNDIEVLERQVRINNNPNGVHIVGGDAANNRGNESDDSDDSAPFPPVGRNMIE